MDYSTWNGWLSELRAIKKMNASRTRVLPADTCSLHVEDGLTMEKLNEINTKLRKIPTQGTDLVHPADSFGIQKIKDPWRRRWDGFKFEQIRKGNWKDGENEEGSVFLQNRGKD